MAQDMMNGTAADISAQNQRVNEEATAWLDSVDISLLTCGPGQEVWSYYGHTALRIEDRAHGSDVAVNWGMFSFRQSFFVLRFVFGLTDYQIGIYPMSDFLAEYTAEGRWVRQQRIRLSREEKLNILRAIEENAKPENRTYRYNFFFDNCTTRAREMILSNIGHSNTNFTDTDTHSSYRQEIHRLNTAHPWARFGNDLLLGVMADQDIDKREWEFLPDNLSKDFAIEGRKDFSASTSLGSEGSMDVADGYVTLVDSTFYLISPQQAKTAKASAADGSAATADGSTTATSKYDDCVTPREVAYFLLLIIVGLCVYEAVSKKNLWWIDLVLMLLTGIPGLILLAMVFSQHPTVQLNYQMLVLNPLNLIFVWKMTKEMRRGTLPTYYEVWGLFIFASLILQIWQDYAEGMGILALSLLIRYAVKSTLLDLGDNKFGLQKFVVKKYIIRKKRRYKHS